MPHASDEPEMTQGATVREPQLSLFEIAATPASTLANVHTPKRGRRERGGVHTWHAYYAGYSEQFVADTLDVLAKPGDFVLDPWNGSGTTTLVAQYSGFTSLGIELNPAMAIHAQAKNVQLVAEAGAIKHAAKAVMQRAEVILEAGSSLAGGLAAWVHREPANALEALRTAILEQTVDLSAPEFLDGVLSRGASSYCFPSPRRAFFLSALFQVLREVGRFKRGSNPTWLVIDASMPIVPTETVLELFITTVGRMLQDLSTYAARADIAGNSWVMTGDSRMLGIRDGVVDLVITSPPYCTRIDYVASTQPELVLLGYDEDAVDGLRRENIGAPVIVDKTIDRSAFWGDLCNAFLESVAQHTSKASQSYYLPIYYQYFRDAEMSLREIRRVLKHRGCAAIVVQSSYYKEIELPLGDIYVEMARELGLHAEISRREAVRQHMAHINTKSREYADNKVYHEDVVYVEKLNA